MNTTLLIARHGNTFGPGDVIRRVGVTDLPLTPAGLEQGRKLGAYLKQQCQVPDVIFTSQLKRAIQTAEQAQQAMQSTLTIHPLAIFNEIDYGPDENKPEEEVVARIGKDALKEWDEHAKVPAGWKVDPQQIIHHWQEFSLQLLREYPGQTILVVTSNGIARFAPYLTGDFASFAIEHGIKIATGALCVFQKNPTSPTWDCLQWNIKPGI